MKECNKCHQTKELTDFEIKNKLTGNRRGQCRSCRYKLRKPRKPRIPKPRPNETGSKQCSKCLQIRNLTEFLWKGYYVRECKKCFYTRQIKTKKERRKTDIQYNLKINLKRLVDGFIRFSTQAQELLGCSVVEFKKHIEKLWTEGMNWNNYGRGMNKWVYDHIAPLDSFDLTKKEEQLKCFHFTNVQPLWWIDNCTKRNLLKN